MYEFIDLKQHCNQIKGSYGAKVSMQEEIRDEFLMEWSEEGQVKGVVEGVKITISPDTRNKIMGAIRLLIATYPSFKLDKKLNSEEAIAVGDKIEILADRIILASEEAVEGGDPVHHNVVYSQMIYGESHTVIEFTKDLVDSAGNDPVKKARAQRIHALSPIIFTPLTATEGYPEWDQYGLIGYYREVTMKLRDAINQFGETKVAKAYKGTLKKDGLKDITVCQYWDSVHRYAWFAEHDGYILNEEHKMPFIPVTVTRGEGSVLFDKPEHQIQPFAYTLWKSGLSKRQNLSLTVAYTNLQKYGMSPAIMKYLNQIGEGPTVEFDKGMNQWSIPYGADVKMADLSGIINPTMMDMLSFADNKIEESTIYSQTLGEKLGANAPFSMVALLHQAGRLPLLTPQRKSSKALASMMTKALLWLREEGWDEDYNNAFTDVIDVKLIPEIFYLKAMLEVNLPQDQMQQAQVATALKGMVPNSWIVENLLQEQNPGSMAKEVMKERAREIKAELYFNSKALEIENMKTQIFQQQQMRAQGAVPPDGMGPAPAPGAEGGEVPEEMPEGPPQDPMTAPMPPLPSNVAPDAGKGRPGGL